MTPNKKRASYEAPEFKLVPVKAWSSEALQTRSGHADEMIDGVSLNRIADQYGTPVFIISEATLRDRFRKMHHAFFRIYDNVQLSWSYKTNYLSAICSIFRSEGAFAEVVSGFEYSIARDLGVPGSDIIFNGPMKTDEELIRAFGDGAHVHADSFEELEQMKHVARTLGRRLDIGIRVNTQLNFPPWSKFGFSFEDGQAREAILTAEKDGLLRVVGLHLHAGTYILEPEIYTTAVNKVLQLALAMESEGSFTLQYLDLGGGYASPNTLHAQFLRGEATCPTFEQYAEAVCLPLVKNLSRLKLRPKLFIEPGRSIVDEGVSMITKVVSSKHLPDGTRAIIVDAGVHILPTAYWYKHEMIALKEGPSGVETINVLGGLCMNIDVLCTDVRLPTLKRNDRILVKCTGAYNFSQSMQFIYMRPNYVLIADGQVHCVREKEDWNYVRIPERLPKHLISAESRGSFLVKNNHRPD